MNEEDIYVKTKYFLLNKDWTPLGGDPPKGTDLPRLEIKKPGEVQSLKKNQDSVINDLVFSKDGKILLIENKPSFNRRDVDKLDQLLATEDWRSSILQAMKQRNLVEKYREIDVEGIISGKSLIKTIAYEGRPRKNLEEFVQICWVENRENPIVKVGDEIEGLSDIFDSA